MSARPRRHSGGTTIHEACTRRYCLRLGPGRCLRGMVGLLGQTHMCRPSPAARFLCVTPGKWTATSRSGDGVESHLYPLTGVHASEQRYDATEGMKWPPLDR